MGGGVPPHNLDPKQSPPLFKMKLQCPQNLKKIAPKNPDDDGNDGSFLSGYHHDQVIMDNITSQTQQEELMFAEDNSDGGGK